MAKNKSELKHEKMHLKALIQVKEILEGEQVSQEDLDLINQYSRKELTADDVYIYPIVLSSNDADREFEYFDKKDLDVLAELFIGKTGIFDHRWSSGNQHSRIFKCRVEAAGTEKNFQEKTLYILKAWAYTIKHGNEDLISKIDAGIYKEVSIGFSVDDLECSICGNSFFDYENCPHYPGREYVHQGKSYICYLRMKDPTDAYEFSFVAVPANEDAGTTKGISIEKEGLKKENQKKSKHDKNSDEETPSIFYAKISKRGEIAMENLRKIYAKAVKENAEEISMPVADFSKDLDLYHEAIQKAEEAEKEKKAAEDKLKEAESKIKMGEQYLEDLKKECSRLGKMAEGGAFNVEMMEKVFDKCSVDELKEFKNQYEKKVDEKYPPLPQTKGTDKDKEKTEKEVDNTSFKM